MKTTLILIMLALTGCGRDASVNSDLKASVERYLAHAPNHGHWDELVSVDWGSPAGGAAGICIVTKEYGQTSRKVRIARRGDPQSIVDALVAHELGHCLHDKIHDDSRAPLLMNSAIYTPDPGWWSDNLDDQIEAMFQ